MDASAVRITVLVDNVATGKGLKKEHGLSLWVEVNGKSILFDTGQGKVLSNNAEKLGVDLEKTDILVLSHGHYDHTGGIPEILKCSPRLDIYLHLESTRDRYSTSDAISPKSLGMSKAVEESLCHLNSNQIHWVTHSVEILPGVGLTGEIPRETDFEDVGGAFFLDPQGERKDPIEDDQALWIQTPEGLVVCVGCCHAGLVNTIHYVQKVSCCSRVRAVIGGFHLLHANRNRLEKTVQALKSISSPLLAPCHCSGENAMKELRSSFPEQMSSCEVGTTFIF